MLRIGSIFIAIFAWSALLPAAAQAACAQWDVTGGGGGWSAVQSNVGPFFRLQQNQIVLQGTAELYYYSPKKTVVAPVNGTIRGDSFDVTLVWPDGAVAGYTGKVGSDGQLRGVAFNRKNPGERVTWYSDVTFACLTAAPETPTGPLKPLGRVTGLPVAPPLPICKAAEVARARNSPAAPGLKAQCDALLSQQVKAFADDGSPAKSH